MTVSLSVAFVAGLKTLVTPCTLALAPVFLLGSLGSSFSLQPLGKEGVRFRFLVAGATLFILGFCFAFVSLALPGSLAERIVSGTSSSVSGIVGVLVIGYALASMLRPSSLSCIPHKRLLALSVAYLLGSIFAVSWIPCVGPTLGTILSIGPASGSAMAKIALLFSYSLGMMAPFFATTVFLNVGLRSIVQGVAVSAAIARLGGLLLFILGIVILTGSVSYPLRYLGSF